MAGSLIAADEKDAPKAEPQFQMSTYVLGFLRKGPNWGQGSKEESARIQESHMANTRKMASTGKLLVAGPMGMTPIFEASSSSKPNHRTRCARWLMKTLQ